MNIQTSRQITNTGMISKEEKDQSEGPESKNTKIRYLGDMSIIIKQKDKSVTPQIYLEAHRVEPNPPPTHNFKPKNTFLQHKPQSQPRFQPPELSESRASTDWSQRAQQQRQGTVNHWANFGVRIRKTWFTVIFRSPLELPKDQLVVPFIDLSLNTDFIKRYIRPWQDLEDIRQFLKYSKVDNSQTCLVRPNALLNFKALCFTKLPATLSTDRYAYYTALENAIVQVLAGAERVDDTRIVFPFMGDAKVMLTTITRTLGTRKFSLKEVAICTEEPNEYFTLCQMFRHSIEAEIREGRMK